MGFVYILKCTNSKRTIYYTGSTTRTLKERISEHINGWTRSTSYYDEHKLVYALQCPNRNVRSVEKYIKKHYRCKMALIAQKQTRARENFKRWLKDHKISAKLLGVREL